MDTYTLSKSNKPEKKWMVSFTNSKTNRNKTIHFGSAGMDDYTISKDPEQKQRYITSVFKYNQIGDPGGIRTRDLLDENQIS